MIAEYVADKLRRRRAGRWGQLLSSAGMAGIVCAEFQHLLPNINTLVPRVPRASTATNFHDLTEYN